MNVRLILVGSALAGWGVLTLLAAAAKAGILLAVALVVVICMRRASAASRHLVWLCALSGALVLPLGFKLLPQWRVLPAWMKWEEVPQLLAPDGPIAMAFSPVIRVGAEEAPDQESPRSAPVPYVSKPVVENVIEPIRTFRLPARWLLGAWGSVAVPLLAPVFISAVSLRRRASRAHHVTSGPMLSVLDSVRMELGMHRPVVVLEGPRGSMPMVWGIFRHRLLLPQGADEWPVSRLRSVLLHEVSHLRRHDPLALLIGHLALAVHWFNPLAWYALKQLRLEQENACDDCVLRHGVRSSDYAEGMLAIASSRVGCLDRFSALTMARESGIESRICGILDSSKNRSSVTRRLAICCALIAVLSAFPVAMLCAGDVVKTVRGRILDRNGIVLAESPAGVARSYPLGAMTAHRVGFIRESSGVAGAEFSHDDRLSRGEDVTLTLDVEIQGIVSQSLEKAGIQKGSAVVVDCRNGDVLANVSFPSHDPNDFSQGISPEKWRAIAASRDRQLVDRTLIPEAPGSTFKVLMAAAAVRTGNAGEIFDCQNSVSFGNSKIACWIWNKQKEGHRKLDLSGALSNSCNCYAVQMANKVGEQGMLESAALLGLGAPTGRLMMPPDSPREMATPRELAGLSIGQGAALASPMQMAVLAAAMANGEKVWVPRFVLDGPPQYRTDLLASGWTAEGLAVIREGMKDTVMADRRVGGRARSGIVAIAGAPGTAQTKRDGKNSKNAWFIGYAPADDPRFAIAVMVEDGASGAGICGPIVREIFEKICSPETGR